MFFSYCEDHQDGFTRAFRRTAVISLTLNPGQEVQNDLILEKYLCHICVLQIVRVFIFICEAEAEFDSNFVCVCVFQCFWRVSVLKYSYISLFFFCLFCCADSDEKKRQKKKFQKQSSRSTEDCNGPVFSVHKLEILSKSANLLTLSLFSSKDGRG